MWEERGNMKACVGRVLGVENRERMAGNDRGGVRGGRKEGDMVEKTRAGKG